VCATCTGIVREGVSIHMNNEPWIDDYEVARLAFDYLWIRSQNRRYIVYLGRSPFMENAIVAVQKTPSGGRVIMARELNLNDLLRVRFWRTDRSDGGSDD